MGLDLHFYWKKKSETMEDIDKLMYDDFDKFLEERELFYGRKAWEIVSFLKLEDGLPIDKERFLELKSALNKLFPEDLHQDYLDSCINNIEHAYRALDKCMEYGFEVPSKYVEAIVDYEVWYDSTFDEPPVLGYEFSLGYMAKLFANREKILKYIDSDEYEVIAIVSF